ncbi:MAG: hypothetical protein QM703_03205 [Gemmatales bacterium]
MDSSLQELRQWESVIRVIGLIVGIITAIFLYRDACYLKEHGARLSPALWAILGFCVSLIAVGIYCTIRMLVWKDQLQTKEEAGVSADPARDLRPETLTASPFPVNDSRYVKPTIYQLIGEMCLVCQKRIASTLEGRFCEICGCGVHNKCARPQSSEVTGNNCSGCGGDPRTRILREHVG